MVGSNPFIINFLQEKAVTEIRRIVGEDFRDLALEDIYKLEYLDMCIKDVLRLFPVAPAILRRITEDYQIGNLYFIYFGDC